jgi:hypothetical protein
MTSASNISGLLSNVKDRERRWFNSVRRTLTESSVINESWRVRFLGFVREETMSKAETAFKESPDVAFYAIERATFPWSYWDERIKNGLPGAERLERPPSNGDRL